MFLYNEWVKLNWPDDTKLHIINKLLLAIIILCCGYILVVPLIPQVDYAIRSIAKPIRVSVTQPDSLKRIDRSHNHLIIPSLQLDQPVLEGADPATTLDRGLWLRPNTSTPDKGSNTVIAGHRFTYTDRPAFYFLDKLKSGDDIFLVYNKKLYHYVSGEAHVVAPTAVEIEDPSSKNRLTLYTCTPLWTATDRLVYVGELKGVL